MLKKSHFFFLLLFHFLFVSSTAFSQSFHETWKEFLENNKISNMSELARPDPINAKPQYAMYLLMNTNSNFCQSDVEDAEELIAEIHEMNSKMYESIPGFLKKMNDIETKIKAYYSIDDIWNKFLRTKKVDLKALDRIEAAKTSCEKRTLAKYSYMKAYHQFCLGNVSESKNIFEDRTLRLAEQTSLRIEDVEGLAAEVAKMKSLYVKIPKLNSAWKTYVKTGKSPGFDIELPLFACNPVPNIKAIVLNASNDVCNSGAEMLDRIKDLKSDSGITLKGNLKKKVKELETAVKQNENNLAELDKAWNAFIPENKVTYANYGHDYCNKEALIKAYIMDGFTFVCDMAEDALKNIDSLQKIDLLDLDEITMSKINELDELHQLYQTNGVEIEQIWSDFILNGDSLIEDFPSTDLYCDHIHEVKDWTMKGLSASCEESVQYLERIEEFNRTFDFVFYDELECRVQRLRIKVWNCQYEALKEIAIVEKTPETYHERLAELMEEYGMEERPEECFMEEQKTDIETEMD